jgi:hypothetical protein
MIRVLLTPSNLMIIVCLIIFRISFALIIVLKDILSVFWTLNHLNSLGKSSGWKIKRIKIYDIPNLLISF